MKMRAVWAAILTSLIFMATSQPAWATTKALLLTYYDCAPQMPAADIPVSAQWKGGEKVLPSTYYLKGVPVYLILDDEGRIQGLQLGKALHIPLDAVAEGVRFGAFKSVMHTLTAKPGFDPDKGGIVEFAYLKAFTPLDILKNFVLSPFRTNSTTGPKWGRFKIHLQRKNGKWIATTTDGQPINEIYTILSLNVIDAVNGLTDMVAIFNKPGSCDWNAPSSETPIHTRVVLNPKNSQKLACVIPN